MGSRGFHDLAASNGFNLALILYTPPVSINQSINQYSFITARQNAGQQLEAKRQYS